MLLRALVKKTKDSAHILFCFDLFSLPQSKSRGYHCRSYLPLIKTLRGSRAAAALCPARGCARRGKCWGWVRTGRAKFRFSPMMDGVAVGRQGSMQLWRRWQQPKSFRKGCPIAAHPPQTGISTWVCFSVYRGREKRGLE